MRRCQRERQGVKGPLGFRMETQRSLAVYAAADAEMTFAALIYSTFSIRYPTPMWV